LDWNQYNISDVGFRLVQRDETRYLGKKVAAWKLALTPRPEHVDERITVNTPLRQPGAYLLQTKMAGGNGSREIERVSDTSIVKKAVDGQTFYYVDDAVSGRAIANANVELFGWQQVHLGGNRYRVDSLTLNETTDKDGQLILDGRKMPNQHNWLVIARKPK